MENSFFFPQTALDQWIVDGTVDLQQNELTILSEGRRYKLVDAVRVLRELTGGGDPQELIGRAKARATLEQLGAEIVESSMLLGDAAYDVEPGWLGVPIGGFAEHMSSEVRRKAVAGSAGAPDPKPDPKSDEELLLRFLGRSPGS